MGSVSLFDRCFSFQLFYDKDIACAASFPAFSTVAPTQGDLHFLANDFGQCEQNPGALHGRRLR